MSSTERKIVLTTLLKKFPAEKSKKIEKSLFLSSKRQSSELELDLKTTYNSFCYEKLGQLFTETDEKKISCILEDIENDVVGWESSVFERERAEYTRKMNRSVNKPKAVKGQYICKYCGCDEFYTWSAQTRSGDEGMTHFRQCFKCGKRGRE